MTRSTYSNHVFADVFYLSVTSLVESISYDIKLSQPSFRSKLIEHPGSKSLFSERIKVTKLRLNKCE
jgi:hypothetical protein